MEQNMTPSEATEKQINKHFEQYRAMLTRHCGDFSVEAFQEALGNPKLLKDQFVVLRTHVEAVSKTITRSVDVDRKGPFKDAIVATGCKPYINWKVVVTMPKCEGGFSATFVCLGRRVKPTDLEGALAKEGWKLIKDPKGLVDLNAEDQTFSDKYPNGTQWEDSDGNCCYVIFDRWRGERNMSVNRDDYLYDGDLFFPCRRKTTSSTATVE